MPTYGRPSTVQGETAEQIPFTRGPFLLVFAVDHQLSAVLKEAMVGAPLSPPEFAVTSALRLLGQVRPTVLAATIGMRPTTLSNHLKRFIDRGLITKRPDPSDGRASLLRLTARGRRDTEACFPAFGAAIASFRRHLAESGTDEAAVVAALEASSGALAATLRELTQERAKTA